MTELQFVGRAAERASQQLMTEAYRRYLEARLREAEPYPGLPIILTLRPRAQKGSAPSRRSNVRQKQ